MSKLFTNVIFIFILTLSLSSNVNGQCKYQYKVNDVITNDVNFVTEPFILCKSNSIEKVYKIKNLTARFEKKGQVNSILINYSMGNTYGKTTMYRTGIDSMVIRFENGEITSIKLNTLASFDMNSFPWKASLSYELTDNLKAILKSGIKVSAIRITNINYNIDISEFDTQLTQKFTDCWID